MILWIILKVANLDHAIVLGVRGVILKGEELVAAFPTVFGNGMEFLALRVVIEHSQVVKPCAVHRVERQKPLIEIEPSQDFLFSIGLYTCIDFYASGIPKGDVEFECTPRVVQIVRPRIPVMRLYRIMLQKRK